MDWLNDNTSTESKPVKKVFGGVASRGYGQNKENASNSSISCLPKRTFGTLANDKSIANWTKSSSFPIVDRDASSHEDGMGDVDTEITTTTRPTRKSTRSQRTTSSNAKLMTRKPHGVLGSSVDTAKTSLQHAFSSTDTNSNISPPTNRSSLKTRKVSAALLSAHVPYHTLSNLSLP